MNNPIFFEKAEIIKAGRKLKMRHVYIFESLMILPVASPWRKLKLTAEEFYVKDTCIGCGKCEKLCPLNNIKMEDKKPVWSGNCTHYMACICNCPKESIEYGRLQRAKTDIFLRSG